MFLVHYCSVLQVCLGDLCISRYLYELAVLCLKPESNSRVSAVSESVFKISPFSLILILSLMRDSSESKGFTDFQNSLLSVTFSIFKFSQYPILVFRKRDTQ